MRSWLLLVLVGCASSSAAPAPARPPADPAPPVDCPAFCAAVATEGLLVNVREAPCRVARGAGKGTIDGRVADASGAPVSGLTVVLTGDGAPDKPSTETASDGTFHFPDLPAGRYLLTFSSRNGNERLGAEDCVVVDGDGASTPVSTTLTSDPCKSVDGGGTVTGTAELPFDDDRFGRAYVNAWSRAGCLVGATVVAPVVAPDGTFALTGLPDGEHTIVLIYAGVQTDARATITAASTATIKLTIPETDVTALITRIRTYQRCGCEDEEEE